MHEFEIHIDRDRARLGLNIFIFAKDKISGKMFKIEPIDLKLTEIDGDGSYNEPTFHFSVLYGDGDSFLKAFAQALTASGYRDQTIAQDGEIKRLESHLEDMRKISFKFIEDKPNV